MLLLLPSAGSRRAGLDLLWTAFVVDTSNFGVDSEGRADRKSLVLLPDGTIETWKYATDGKFPAYSLSRAA